MGRSVTFWSSSRPLGALGTSFGFTWDTSLLLLYVAAALVVHSLVALQALLAGFSLTRVMVLGLWSLLELLSSGVLDSAGLELLSSNTLVIAGVKASVEVEVYVGPGGWTFEVLPSPCLEPKGRNLISEVSIGRDWVPVFSDQAMSLSSPAGSRTQSTILAPQALGSLIQGAFDLLSNPGNSSQCHTR